MAKKSQVYAKHISADISSKKIEPVMDLIRGQKLEQAKLNLTFDRSKGAKLLLKVLKSAEANAVNNNKLNPESLIVDEVWAGQATPGKRANFGARGRFSFLVSKKCNLYIGLSEDRK